MSHLIPPLVSNSPPPMVAGGPDDLDDEFGDFAVPGDINYGYSLPSSPMHIPNSPYTQNAPSMSNGVSHYYVGDETFDKCDTSKTGISLSVKQVPKLQQNCSKSEFSDSVSAVCSDVDIHLNQKCAKRQESEEFGDFETCTESNNEDATEISCQKENFGDLNNVKNEISKKNGVSAYLHANIEISDKIITTNEFENIVDTKVEQNCKLPEAESSNFSEIKQNTFPQSDNFTKLPENNNSDTENIFEEFQINTDSEKSELSIEKTVLDKEKITYNTELNVEQKLDEISSEQKSDCEKSETNSEFGDFETSPVHQASSDVQTDKDKPENEFATFESPIQSERRLENIEQDSFDDFTTFKTSDQPENQNSEFGSFENSPVRNKNVESVPSEVHSDFGEFSSPVVVEDANSDFGDFEGSPAHKPERSSDKTVESSDFESNIPDLDLKFEDNEETQDFCDFESMSDKFEAQFDDLNNFSQFESNTGTFQPTPAFETNFDDFQKSTDDDFGDFNDYSTQTSLKIYKKGEIFDAADRIIKNIFPMKELDVLECDVVDFTNNPVFRNLCVIENTNALSYQWNSSRSQRALLKALNIDSRNILYGPRWNPTMPKFASNLGFAPLEPQRSELPPVPSTIVQSEPQQSQVEVPDAKFDWTSSGLTNPLDCSPEDLLLDLEQLVTSLHLPSAATVSFLNSTSDLAPSHHHTSSSSNNHHNHNQTVPPAPPDQLDSWDLWLQSQLNSSNKEPSEDKTEIMDNGFKLPNTDILSLQQETVSTNSRAQSDTESVNSLKFATDLEVKDAESPADADADEFGGFESSKPETWSFTEQTPIKETTIPPSESWTHMQPLRETYISDNLAPNLIDEGNWLGSTLNSPVLDRKVETVQEPEDDFSDFQMVLPQNAPVEPLPPLEPLKPIVLQPTVVPIAPTKINWPEPGIIDDTSISEIDLKYSKTNDEDDWSDFVSVSKPEPIKVPVKTSDPFSLISTTSNFSNLLQSITTLPGGQLELSVPNLQNTHIKYNALPAMQAPSVAKPVNSPPSTQQIAAQQVQYGYTPPYQIPLTNQSTGSQFNLEPTEIGPAPMARKQFKGYQPNYPGVSEHKQKNLLGDLSFSPKKESLPNTIFTPVQNVENTFLKMQQSTLPTNTDDDEEWSDFVSNQSVSEVSNGWNGKNDKQKPNFSWSEMTPNIITNPVHFDVFQSYQPTSTNQKKAGNIFSPPKNVPSISTLPELDFIAPKSKFFTKK